MKSDFWIILYMIVVMAIGTWAIADVINTYSTCNGTIVRGAFKLVCLEGIK